VLAQLGVCTVVLLQLGQSIQPELADFARQAGTTKLLQPGPSLASYRVSPVHTLYIDIDLSGKHIRTVYGIDSLLHCDACSSPVAVNPGRRPGDLMHVLFGDWRSLALRVGVRSSSRLRAPRWQRVRAVNEGLP
jgi:hypothetical protein